MGGEADGSGVRGVRRDRCAEVERTLKGCRVSGGRRQTRTFGTTTGELLELSDWLTEAGVTHVGIESTGEFWRPVHNILEGNFEVWLLNAQHSRRYRAGRPTWPMPSG